MAMQKETAARILVEDASRTKSQFLKRASHELRTPLATIKGAASSLLSGDVEWTKDQIHEFLVMLDESADKLGVLVDQMVYASTSQANGEVNIVDIQFQKIIDQALPQVQLITSEHPLNITIPDDLPAVSADSYLTIQVLINLVDNAVKFSPSNTPITITAHEEDEFIQVDISDVGRGIPVELRDQVFEPFKQVDPDIETTSQGLGLGLGLAVCKRLIEMQGGKIWLEPEIRKGTVVSFTLPVI